MVDARTGGGWNELGGFTSPPARARRLHLTAGTSPVTDCYDVVGEFGAEVRQAAHVREGSLIMRKVEDAKNSRACLVAYVGTPGTSSRLFCY